MEFKETTKSKGVHIITLADISSSKALKLQDLIEKNISQRDFMIRSGLATKEILFYLWGQYNYYVGKLNKLFKTQEFVIENITTTIGRSVLAQRLGGDTTYTGTVNYTALGSDNTAPAVGDATLGTEVYRKALSSGTDNNNIAYLETFFTATEDSGTYEEYGMFIDGAAGADTGQLFNRFTTSITKSATESLNVQSIITFADA